MVLAVRMKRASVLEKPRCPWMIERGTGPKNSHVLVDLFVGDAEIVREPAPSGFAQLFVDIFRVGVRKILPFSEAFREFPIDPAIVFGVPGRVHGVPEMNVAALFR